MRTLCSLLLVLAACKGAEPTEPTSEPTPTATPTPPGVDADGDGHTDDVDCNDDDPSIHPGATELCNGIDDDCTNAADDGLVFLDYYLDADDDGHGDSHATPTPSCDPIQGAVTNNDDCDDANPHISPAATELCNGIDDDCTHGADDGLAFLDYYPDTDGDGHGDGAATPTHSCSPVLHAVANGDDCDDTDPHISPDATETCNGIDDDCANGVDDGIVFVDYFPDADGDGFGDQAATATSSCVPVSGMVTDATDCDDASHLVNPAATETCNDVDDDCTNGVDDGVTSAFFVDLDHDGYGAQVQACSDPDGDTGELPGDCDDDDPDTHPGAEDACNGVDNDCSGDVEHLVPDDFSEVSEAIAAASPGDTLCIGAGTYGPAVVDKDLSLVGAGSDQVAIDGGSTGRALEIATGVTQAGIRGVTLQNGDAPTGAGLRINEANGAVTLEEVVVADNYCSATSCAGVGIWFTGELTMIDVHLNDNDADLPGDGNLTGVGIYGTFGSLVMEDSEVVGSMGTCQGSIWIDGGAMHLNDVEAVITDSEFRDNALVGGQTRAHAVGAYGNNASLLMERVRIEGNSAYGDTWPYPAKGAVQLGVDAEIRNTLIVDNHVDGESGNILGNALTTFGNKTVSISHSTIANNTAGALDPWGSVLDGNSNTVSFSHVILAGNSGSSMIYSSGTTSLDHTLAYDSGFLGSSFASGAGNQVEVDPLFVDPAHGDYHLGDSSPAIDAGDATIDDPDGTTSDLGAYGGPYAD